MHAGLSPRTYQRYGVNEDNNDKTITAMRPKLDLHNTRDHVNMATTGIGFPSEGCRRHTKDMLSVCFFEFSGASL